MDPITVEPIVDAHVERLLPEDYRLTLTLASGETRSVVGADLDDDGDPLDDADDLLVCLLRLRVPLEVTQRELALVEPEFDLAAAIDHLTMPDRAKQRALDEARRLALKQAFRQSRD